MDREEVKKKRKMEKWKTEMRSEGRREGERSRYVKERGEWEGK